MKIIAVYDSSGSILAAVVDDGKPDMPRPVPDHGTQKVGTFRIPESISSLPIEQICTTYRINSSTGTLEQFSGNAKRGKRQKSR